MEIIEAAAGAVIAAAIVSPISWFLSKWDTARADKRKLSASQWSLELLKDDEWTLHRDSPNDAFALNVWEEGTAASAGKVKFGEHLERGDLRSGKSVKLIGIRPGTEVKIDWVEKSMRLATRAVIREGERKVVLTRDDTKRVV